MVGKGALGQFSEDRQIDAAYLMSLARRKQETSEAELIWQLPPDGRESRDP
jgi:hypothetical protein